MRGGDEKSHGATVPPFPAVPHPGTCESDTIHLPPRFLGLWMPLSPAIETWEGLPPTLVGAGITLHFCKKFQGGQL